MHHARKTRQSAKEWLSPGVRVKLVAFVSATTPLVPPSDVARVCAGASRRRGHGKKKQCPETDTETLTPRRSSTLASMVLTAEYRAAASRGGSPVARMRREAQASLSSLTRLISSDRPFHVGLAQRQESTRSICRGADCRYVVTVYSKQPPASQPYTGHLYGRSYDLVCHWFKCVPARHGSRLPCAPHWHTLAQRSAFVVGV
jgi:hypothetical protein